MAIEKKAASTVRRGRPKKSEGGGGKLARSETVNVRFDPKLRFAAVLAAKRHGRTLSSFIEWAVSEAIKEVELLSVHEEVVADQINQKKYRTAENAMDNVWDVEEADRFAKKAMIYPNLMNYGDQILWKLAVEDKTLWKKRTDMAGNIRAELNFVNFKFKQFRENWETFKNTAKGKISI